MLVEVKVSHSEIRDSVTRRKRLMLRGHVFESNISPRHNVKIERVEGAVWIVVGCLALPCCQYRPSAFYRFRHSRWTLNCTNWLKIKEKRKKREKEKGNIEGKKKILTTASRDEERETTEGEKLKITCDVALSAVLCSECKLIVLLRTVVSLVAVYSSATHTWITRFLRANFYHITLLYINIKVTSATILFKNNIRRKVHAVAEELNAIIRLSNKFCIRDLTIHCCTVD